MTTDNLVEQFLVGLSWVLQRKDMDSFWPIGFASTMTRYGPSFVRDLEERLEVSTNGTNEEFADFPTSLIVVALAVVYGTFGLDWSSGRKHMLLERILRQVEAKKHGSPLNTTWKNEILSSEDAFFAAQNGPRTYDQNERIGLRLCNRLSGLLLAYAEAFCFCNHRIFTEKHGPYFTNEQMILIRSAKNLKSPPLFWDDVGSIAPLFDRLPVSIEMYFRSDPYDVRFDMYSNIIHSEDVNRRTREVKIAVYPSDWKDRAEGGSLVELIDMLEILEKEAVTIVGVKTQSALQEQLMSIMYFACRHIFGPEWKELCRKAVDKGREKTCFEVPSGPKLLATWVK